MNDKHFFAGNNTAHGFYSYFDYLFNPNDANRIYILKGGPGVGKSSFMKKFSANMVAKGYSVEYIHCASDNESLDGIIIPKLKLAFVDGTAPHTIDPSIPGAVDEIINLGTHLDNKQLEENKVQIAKLIHHTSVVYKSAYRFLKGAGIILEEIDSIYEQVTDDSKFGGFCEEVINKVFIEDLINNDILQTKQLRSDTTLNKNAPGKIRKLFSDAYTAIGYIDHTSTLIQDKKVLTITGNNANYTSKLLDSIALECIKRGYDTDCIYRPLQPEKLQHIVIPKLNLMLTSAKNELDVNCDHVIDLSTIMDIEKLKTYQSGLDDNLLLFDHLTKNALEKLSETKMLHEQLEAFYINAMDFRGVDECFEQVLSDFS